tara:strand:+ start:1173 stop:1859 length:687 start_codon:yes stop_codon:yes gene_type:complete
MSNSDYYGNLQAFLTEKPKINKVKGTEIMDAMLLSQYANSDNLKAYILAFVEEMDFLFEQIEEVYLGRFLEFAVGRQLDVCGIILDQSRAILLPKSYFGFQGAITPDKMADEVTPSNGGYFKSETDDNFVNTPLDDTTYRRLLLAKAYANTLNHASLDETYQLVTQLLGRVPQKMQLLTSSSTLGSVAARTVELHLSLGDTSTTDSALIEYFAKYMVPLGTTFTIIRS